MIDLPPLSALIGGRLSDTVADLRGRIETAAEESTTGRRADLTGHLGGTIGKAMLSQKAVTDLEQERTRIGFREARLDMIQRSLTDLHDDTNEVHVRMLAARGAEDGPGQAAAARGAESALEQAFSALNARYGERYLFSGDATSTKPFAPVGELLADIRTIAETATDAADFEAQLDDYFNDPAGGWRTDIYSGTETATDPDAVTGMDPGLRRLVSGLAVYAISAPGDQPALIEANPSILDTASERVSEGQAQVMTLRADRGVVQAEIAERLETIDAEETLLADLFNDMAARDQYEAATELRELERNLEAAYLLTSRLANLSLLNYLR